MYRRRPKYLNLTEIRLPLPAIVSVLHRISGAFLFFPGIPILLYGLQMLLDSPESYSEAYILLAWIPVKVVLTFLLWFFMHHLCAGIRHLALDLHFGEGLGQSRKSSVLVFLFSIILTLLFGAGIW
ncbi:MAG: succinate dehydrogenase, cytochrome b556 subunit [Nitrosomonadaceae bacterium]|mgnify:CR=1 FL=1|nr:succinate dehydrogenase, cytochrome b556 subunit [Nitrosomonadaceae bacterium]